MKIAIIGGKLQGTEAVYLAKLAGIQSILIDRNSSAPASGICDRFVCGDIVQKEQKVIDAMKEADFVLPANENDLVLKAVREICEEENLKLAFDFNAYEITSSKIKSDKLFHRNHIPAPLYYPQGKAPYIIKPSGESGSVGVLLAETEQQAEAFLRNRADRENWIAEEYLEGPSYSIEVIGNEKEYRTYTVTQIHMDSVYDCCKVTAPCPELTEVQKEEFSRLGITLAKLIHLNGIMDVEVILHEGQLKVLEIDARIPSQTPVAVYYSSGVNLLSELADMVLYGSFCREKRDDGRYCAYEHYKLEQGEILQEGEHMMSSAEPLHLMEGAFGSDVILSDYAEGCSQFKGIFVNSASDPEQLEEKRASVAARLKQLP
ncbi:3-methylornithine--L-lysine ligase PylC [Aminipila luticellarii]|uniref:3-methylornithine--L-lysine ligase PylC n=1 Tax=Aminipila luticellarii TaxID=2507160 RepID=A0A410PWY4_9FIRM|nr:3-methylornithine--L-lysine ligase PylC [Aminipila luticellarii]QAT43390.1 3-methylornithine--L-lysine ligase PylC [Aminipila luticellarii]